MAKNHKKNQKKNKAKIGKPNMFALPEETKKWIWGVLILILAVIVALSFFDLAGVAGKTIMEGLTFLIGKAVFIIPLIFVLGGLVFFKTRYDKFLGPVILGILILIVGVSGILEILDGGEKQGGLIGYVFSFPFLKLFGALVSEIIFGAIILIGGLVFWHLISGPKIKKTEKSEKLEAITLSKEEKKPSLIEKIFAPQFKVKEVEPKTRETPSKLEESILELKEKQISQPAKAVSGEYRFPPIELLETDKGKPTAGDTITNSTIIKKTLENFGLGVDMSEINIGPTVTQYTLKPADGIKLSKITGLNNNLSLALASHPIRIEAPIPGKPLVGIEVPNKERCKVRLRDLISNPVFQNSASTLTIVLGRDVSGAPCYADLARMPHLLVAGSTGTGKTIFLNSLIASLLYQNSPSILRFILIDPKRVEFSAYHELPHLLTPVIFDAQRSVNSLKWLISEMERRFDVLSGNGSRDINSYNTKILKEGGETLPYIVLIVDELADLMASKGREMEAGIVRLAQMSRAVGIHLVLATQRPSVEVITGLIKANVTSRVTFQVASQVDSRTVLDMAGAEKLLGLGDMLFISAEVAKPKRVQGAYVSEKEVRKVVDYTKSKNPPSLLEERFLENHLAEELEKTLEGESPGLEDFSGGEDSLYEEAKRTVVEEKKASASYLQRRLRIGYARAARLLDMLERQGIVGPAEGAKPREIYYKTETDNSGIDEQKDEWQKV